MIKNQKQANATRNKILELKKELEKFEMDHPDKNSAHYKFGSNGFNGIIEELQGKVNQYDSLVKGNFNCIHPKKLSDIPQALIAGRLAKKISQKKLANLLMIKEQQVQRYEAEDYESASINRVFEVAKALNMNFYFEKILIINPIEEEEHNFEIPKGITKEQIRIAKQKIIQSKCLIIE